jgi:hypothetical protein
MFFLVRNKERIFFLQHWNDKFYNKFICIINEIMIFA